jgi:ADP-ribose pyrophosphatase YjhB (NUDIX family)
MYIKQFQNYTPKNEQEKVDLKLILDFIKNNSDCLYRTNLVAHVTSSAFVVNKKMDKILFAYHNIYNSWAWVGGHNDGNPNLLDVAILEAIEETGVKNIFAYSNDIFTIDVIYVKNHIKHHLYVPDHLHLNASFLLIADENDELIINEKENSGVKWFDLDEALNIISEDRMKPVYEKAFKLIKKLR